MLTAKREKFAQKCASLAPGETVTDAYRYAFDTKNQAPNTIWGNAHRLHKNSEVRARINELKSLVEKEAVMSLADIRDLVLRDALDVIKADPSDLITYRRLNCRYCHGTNHAYRWRDEAEFWGALAQAAEAQDAWENLPEDRRTGKRPQLPTDDGGYGFKRLAPPSEDCPKCEGEGLEEARVADIRRLSGAARRLYAGVKVKKDGSIELLMRDKESARLLLAKYSGAWVDKVEHKGAVGLYPIALSDEQRATILKAIDDDI